MPRRTERDNPRHMNEWSNIPRMHIGRWPTPIRSLTMLSAELGIDVFSKDENDCAAWGGNKVRKLEYVLEDARRAGADELLAYGAGTSSWVAACALHGSRAGFSVIGAVGGQVPDAYDALYRGTRTQVYAAPSLNRLPLAVARAKASRRRARLLPAGGTSRLGDVGSAGAGREIARSVRRREIPRPVAVVAAAGTGGTCGGLATGLAAGGLGDVQVIAVRVTPRPLGTAPLVRRRATLAGRTLAVGPPARISTMDDLYAPGYGRAGRAAVEAQRLGWMDDLDLDLAYGAKALAGLIRTARTTGRGPLLFLNTSPGPLPDATMTGARS